MATTVGQHGVAAFTNPSNGDALDATVVKANDNTLRDAYVTHDDDSGIHLQSSTLAARPSAGTAGRKWLTTDTGSVKLWYDNGSTWEEISYIQSTGAVTLPSDLSVGGNASVTGNATITGDGTINGNVALGNATTDTVSVTGRVNTSVVPSVTATNDLGTTSLRWRDLYVGGITASGTVTANTFSGSGASLTGIAASGIAGGTFGGTSYTFTNSVTFNTSITLGAGTRIIETYGAVSASGTQTVNLTSSITRVTLTGNATLTLGSLNVGSVILQIVQDGTGGRTLTITNAVYAGGVAPTWTTTAGRMDILQVVIGGVGAVGPYIAVLGQNYVP